MSIVRSSWLLLTAALVVAGLMLAPSAGAAGKPNCQGPLTQDVVGNLTAGPGCNLGSHTVTGDVNVAQNGSLAAAGANIQGNLTIAQTSSASTICGTQVGHDVQIHDNSGPISFGGGACNFWGSSAGHDAKIEHNTGDVDLNGSVGHDLTVDKNQTPDPVMLSGGSVGHDLDCHDNTPDANPGSMTVGHAVRGNECTSTQTTTCPAAGCTTPPLNSAGGDAVTSVTVPPTPNGGTVTVSFSPAPPDDGCLGGEGGSQPIGSVLRVVLPAGVSSSNPAVVHLEWFQSNGEGSSDLAASSICKSVTGQAPFTLVSECQGGESFSTPCWTYTDTDNDGAEFPDENDGGGVDVYLATNDPVISGH
jgi:hypothetical protein